MSSSSSITNTRLTGMASMLDTESIVADMMKASKLRLQSVEQQKILLEWKKDSYKEILTNFYNFQKEFFSNNSTSLSSALTSPSAVSSSGLVSAQSSSMSSSKNIYIDDIISLASSASLESSMAVSANPSIDINTDNLSLLAGKSITIYLDGKEKVLTFSQKEYTTSESVRAELQSLADSAFGSGRITADLSGDKITLSSANSIFTLKSSAQNDASAVLSFGSYSSNRIDPNISLNSAGLASPAGDEISFSINGVNFNFTSSNSVSQIMTAINDSDAGVNITYSSLKDKFTLTSKETGASAKLDINETKGSLMNSLFGSGIKKDGTDAVVTLSPTGSKDPADFYTITRSSNSFSIDGVGITLNGKSEGSLKEQIDISLKYDTDAAVSKIKSFVESYNKLLSSITTKISEEYDRDYPPLTDEQKSDMKEAEIETWTKKARTGILANDIYLKTIQAELRSCMYTGVAKLSDNAISEGTLAQIGISTTVYSDKGKLTINEDKLRAALNSDSAKVFALFTQKSDKSFSLYSSEETQRERFLESGVLERISDLLNKNLSKVGKKGALINLVGSPSDTYTGDTIYSKRIKDIDTKIAKMQDSMAAEEDRYWNQFTAMESAISKINQQSSWLSGMLGNK